MSHSSNFEFSAIEPRFFHNTPWVLKRVGGDTQSYNPFPSTIAHDGRIESHSSLPCNLSHYSKLRISICSGHDLSTHIPSIYNNLCAHDDYKYMEHRTLVHNLHLLSMPLTLNKIHHDKH